MADTTLIDPLGRAFILADRTWNQHIIVGHREDRLLVWNYRRPRMGTLENYDTVEGVVGDSLAYHFDMTDDVLYLRLISTQEQEVFGEETPEGFLLFQKPRTRRSPA